MNHKKTVLVTGSSRGIGKAIAKKFGSMGYNVVLNCIKNFEMMENLKQELEADGVECMAIGCDVSDYQAVEKMFEEITAKFGGIDVLINNAGVATYGLFNTSDPSEWSYIMNNNFYSALNCSHRAIPYMLGKNEGIIINLSSIWGITGASCECMYSASKGAIISFTKALAKELGPSGIRVNAIAPGAIDTDMTAPFTGEDREDIEYRVPLSRFGMPDEIADMVYSMSQNTYLNGQVITVDGGLI